MNWSHIFSADDSRSFLAHPLSRQEHEVEIQNMSGRLTDEQAQQFRNRITAARSRYPRSYRKPTPWGWLQDNAARVTEKATEGFNFACDELRTHLLPSAFSFSRPATGIVKQDVTAPTCLLCPIPPKQTIRYDFEPQAYVSHSATFEKFFGHSISLPSFPEKQISSGMLQVKIGSRSGLVSIVMTSALSRSEQPSAKDRDASDSLAQTLGSHLADEIDFAVSSLLDTMDPKQVKSAMTAATHPRWLIDLNDIFCDLHGQSLFNRDSGANLTAVIWLGKNMFVAHAGLHTLLHISSNSFKIIQKADSRSLIEDVCHQSRKNISWKVQNLLREVGSFSGIFYADDKLESPARLSHYPIDDDDLDARKPLLVFLDGPLPALNRSPKLDWRHIAMLDPQKAVVEIDDWLKQSKTSKITHVAAFRCPTLTAEIQYPWPE